MPSFGSSFIYICPSVRVKIMSERSNMFETQAGTYIKEFVHGDLGRTNPRYIIKIVLPSSFLVLSRIIWRLGQRMPRYYVLINTVCFAVLDQFWVVELKFYSSMSQMSEWTVS